VVTHPEKTSTCFEKAELLGWDPLNVIKALYFEDIVTGALYATVVPETGCFVDVAVLSEILGVTTPAQLRKASSFPRNMERGTCSPFVTPVDLAGHGGRLAKLLFDTGSLVGKRGNGVLDDFSFGLDHRPSRACTAAAMSPSATTTSTSSISRSRSSRAAANAASGSVARQTV
jgi:hypothetical protein